MAVDLDEMADRVVDKALDEFTYNGLTIREWVELIVTEDLLAIAVLEKIKGKIIINDNFEWVFSGRKFIEKKAILDIIDKEISELKGETNGQA